MGYDVGLFYLCFFSLCSFGWLFILGVLFVLFCFVLFFLFVFLFCFVSRIHPPSLFFLTNPFYLVIVLASHVVEGCAALYALEFLRGFLRIHIIVLNLPKANMRKNVSLCNEKLRRGKRKSFDLFVMLQCSTHCVQANKGVMDRWTPSQQT